MLVVLSKEEEREEKVAYNLSDLIIDNQEEMRKKLKFSFDESENETFMKLKRMELLDY